MHLLKSSENYLKRPAKIAALSVDVKLVDSRNIYFQMDP